MAGDRIYEGRVYALDGRAQPLFRYERRVLGDETLTSTHVTHDPQGAIVVVQSAVHSPSYDLHRADMIHRQTGTTASVVVANGEATFTLGDGSYDQTTFRERLHDPLVAGPTMFGYILAHWDQLTHGAHLPIRFAVLERGESLGFVLDQIDAPQGRTIIRMSPSSLIVRLAVAPTYFQFDTASRRIIEYTGRVPPLEQVDNRLTTLDARVAYSFVAPAFR